MKKDVKLQWFAMRWDFNKKCVESCNVLAGLLEPLKREVKSGSIYNKSILREWLKTELMYNYWSKTEQEMLVTGLHENNNWEKIDVWKQIEPNLDKITEYINRTCDLKFE